jgi:hypothetical protein
MPTQDAIIGVFQTSESGSDLVQLKNIGGPVIFNIDKQGAINWRNNANTADIALTKDTNDNLTYNGNVIATTSGVPWSNLALSATNTGTGMVLAPTATGTVPFQINAPSGMTVDAFDVAVGSSTPLRVTSNGIVNINNTLLGTNSVFFNGNSLTNAAYLASVTSPGAGSGFVRMASTDSIAWRNNGNTADVLLAKNSSDALTYNGNVIATMSGVPWSSVTLSATNTGTGMVLAPTATGTVPFQINAPSGMTVNTFGISAGNGKGIAVDGSGNLAITTSTAATSTQAQASPLLTWQGQYWNGTASATDYWEVFSNIGSGTNGPSVLTFTHTGTSGTAIVNLPAILSGSSSPAQSGFERLASGDTISWRNNANTADIALAKDTSDNLTYNGHVIATTSGPVGGLQTFAIDLTAQQANFATQTFTTPSANGYYLVSAYDVITQVASSSSTTPSITVNYTDADSGSATNITIISGNSSNAVGSHSISPAYPIYAKSGVAITLSSSGYVSSGATSMQYALHARLQGPF